MTNCIHIDDTYHCYEPAHESKVAEVVRIDSRGRVDLHRIVRASRIFKQAIHGVEYFMRNEKEKLSGENSQCIQLQT